MKTLQKYLCEGAWSYVPSDGNDEVGDCMDELMKNFVYDVDKMCKDLNSYEDGNDSWTVIGIVDNLFRIINSIDWYVNIRQSDITKEYERAIEICKGDSKFIDSWDDIKKIQQAIKEAKKRLIEYKKHY